MVQHLLFGVIGLTGILFGAQLAIVGSQRFAKKLGMSEFFIGLTVLSIGTSLPEFFTHLISAFRILREPENILTISGIAVGTDIGSDLMQITLIVGVIGLITRVHTTKQFMHRDYVFMLFGIFLLWVFCLDSAVVRLEGATLLILYLLYLWRLGSEEHFMAKLANYKKQRYAWDVFFIIMGLLLLAACAEFVLSSALFFSAYWHITGSLIGVMFIGVSTALPEFAAALTAVLRKSSGLSLGTLIGSNIAAPLFALGLASSISTYRIDFDILWIYIPFWFFASLLGFIFFKRGYYLYKWEACVLIVSYIAFVTLRLVFGEI